MNKENTPKKCYNTFSCIASVIIIIFITGAILADLIVSKPKIYRSIDTIREEVEVIHQRIDEHYLYQPTMGAKNLVDSLETEWNIIERNDSILNTEN